MYDDHIQKIATKVLKRAEIRTRCAEAQNWRCAYCQNVMTIERGSRQCSFDHVIPVSLGGSDTYENCVAACMSCNGKRGSEDANSYFEKKDEPNPPKKKRTRPRNKKRKAKKESSFNGVATHALKIINGEGYDSFVIWFNRIKSIPLREFIEHAIKNAA